MDVFCTTIIPTINRPTLSRAVRSVLDQSFTDSPFEVIVVNDSGRPLPRMDWQESSRVRVINTDRGERCIARNAGAAAAVGRYLHFLDDDDMLLPGALKALWNLSRSSDAPWLYGSYQAVDSRGSLVEEYHPGLAGNIFALLLAGESIPLQASLLKTEAFRSAGGFDPAVCGTEDRDLGRRIALSGTVACTPALVARIRIGLAGSTTDWSTIAETDRCGREKAFKSRGAFARSLDSARSARLRGRVSRAYIASAAWNVENRRPLRALIRAIAGAGAAGRYVLAPDFWRGLRTRPP